MIAAIPLLISLATLAPSSAAATLRPDTLTVEALERMTAISEVALSPGGATVVYRQWEPIDQEPGWRSGLWAVDLEDGRPRRVYEDAGGARWTGDGEAISFLRTIDGGQQVWLAPSPGAEPRQITSHPGGVLDFAWAPGGGRLAFVAIAAEGERSGSSQVFVQALDGTARQLTAVEGNVHTAFFGGGTAISWSPDGGRIAFSVQPGRSFEDVYDADVGVVDADGGAPRAVVSRPGMDILPRFSPDGSRLAFVTSFGERNRLAGHGLAIVDVATGRVEDAGRALDAAFLDAPANPAWSPDGRRLYFEHAVGTSRELGALDRDGGPVAHLTALGGVASRFSFSADGRRVAFLGSTADRPFDVYVLDVGSGPARQVTRTNEHLADLALPPVRTVSWAGGDGTPLEGLFIGDGSPGTPVIVWLHGGPEGHAVSAFDPTLPFPSVPFDPFPLRLFAARGYAVFAPNFRGSAGYGSGMRLAAAPEPGDRTAEDVLLGLDALAAAGSIDPGRAALVGWASGGLKVADLLVRTDRFRAAALGAAATDLFSAFGEGDAIVQWTSLLGGTPWEARERYVRESPLFHADRISTPTLLIHGDLDRLVPIEQTRQLHTYLRLLGVPTELVVLPGEGHGVIHPRRRSELAETVLEWIDRWMAG